MSAYEQDGTEASLTKSDNSQGGIAPSLKKAAHSLEGTTSKLSEKERDFNAGFFLRFISRNRNAFRFCFDRVFIRQTAGQFKLVKHG